MKKYKPANLQSVKEFIQRMLDGEVFYGECTESKYYFTGDRFCEVNSDGQAEQFIPATVVGWQPLLTEVSYTIQEALAEKPRLCWVWDRGANNPEDTLVIITNYNPNNGHPYTSLLGEHKYAELATLEEIKQFLED